jgi:hypothetical protein
LVQILEKGCRAAARLMRGDLLMLRKLPPLVQVMEEVGRPRSRGGVGAPWPADASRALVRILELGRRSVPLHRQVRRLVRAVGVAVVGSSGHGCLG